MADGNGNQTGGPPAGQSHPRAEQVPGPLDLGFLACRPPEFNAGFADALRHVAVVLRYSPLSVVDLAAYFEAVADSAAKLERTQTEAGFRERFVPPPLVKQRESALPFSPEGLVSGDELRDWLKPSTVGSAGTTDAAG